MLPMAANPKYVMIDPITTTDLNLDSKIHRKFCVSVSSGLVIAWKNTIHPTTTHPIEKMMNASKGSENKFNRLMKIFMCSGKWNKVLGVKTHLFKIIIHYIIFCH